MKFTEEQFKQLVKIQEKYFPDNVLENGLGGGSPCQAIRESDIKMRDFIWAENLANEAVAIMNPATREWAHEQFVEKEPKFHFILKDTQDLTGRRYHLVRSGRGAIIIYPFAGNDKPKFKESEIKAWGYNPEMFDREHEII